jgi:hypothetical protein
MLPAAQGRSTMEIHAYDWDAPTAMTARGRAQHRIKVARTTLSALSLAGTALVGAGILMRWRSSHKTG